MPDIEIRNFYLIYYRQLRENIEHCGREFSFRKADTSRPMFISITGSRNGKARQVIANKDFDIRPAPRDRKFSNIDTPRERELCAAQRQLNGRTRSACRWLGSPGL